MRLFLGGEEDKLGIIYLDKEYYIFEKDGNFLGCTNLNSLFQVIKKYKLRYKEYVSIYYDVEILACMKNRERPNLVKISQQGGVEVEPVGVYDIVAWEKYKNHIFSQVITSTIFKIPNSSIEIEYYFLDLRCK